MLRDLSNVLQDAEASNMKKKRLHIDLNQSIPYRDVLSFNMPPENIDGRDLRTTNGVTEIRDAESNNWYSYYDFDYLKTNYLKPVRKFFYHYLVLGRFGWNKTAQQRHTWMGRSEIIGNDLFVAFPFKKSGSTELVDGRERMGLIFHELGHNLGLLHNGNTTKSNEQNNRDQYLSEIHASVMNYRYMQYGIDGDMDREEDVYGNVTQKFFGNRYSYSTGDSRLNDSRFNLTKKTIRDYHIEHGENDDYVSSHGPFNIDGYCSTTPTKKVWNWNGTGEYNPNGNYEFDCSKNYHPTCDCDVEEWQNLWVDFWFDWQGRRDPDALYTEKTYSQESINEFINNFINFKITEQTKKKQSYFKYPSLTNEYFFSNGRMENGRQVSPYRLLSY